MKSINDEMLNRYIDGELTPEEMKLIDEQIISDTELKRRLLSLRKVHSELSTLHPDETSPDFTLRVMQKILKRYKVPKEQKIFITAVVSFFGILCAFFLGFILIKISDAISNTISAQSNNHVEQYVQNIVYFLSDIFGGLSISVFGSVLSLIILVSAYFFFDLIKRSKTI